MRAALLLAMMTTLGSARAFSPSAFVSPVASKLSAFSQQKAFTIGRVRPPLAGESCLRSGAASIVSLADVAGTFGKRNSHWSQAPNVKFGLPASVACRSASTDSAVEADAEAASKPAVKKRVVSGVQVCPPCSNICSRQVLPVKAPCCQPQNASDQLTLEFPSPQATFTLETTSEPFGSGSSTRMSTRTFSL
jgi:hypothetical protein